MRYCSVQNCPTKSGDGISMHGFQKDWFSLSAWKNENPLYVCSRHFDTKHFRGQKHTKLVDNAKPYKFLHHNALYDHSYAKPDHELYTPHCIMTDMHCLCTNVSGTVHFRGRRPISPV